MSARRTGLYCLCALTVFAITACGGSHHSRTPYGNAAEVRDYRDRIDAVVDAANAVQDTLEREAVGSSGQATGENLSVVCERLRPQLQSALDLLRSIEPPTALTEMHARMEQVLVLRLRAFEQIASGWTLEQTESFAVAEPLYDEAEGKLSAATEIAAQVNDELAAVDVALADAEGRDVVA